MASTFAGIEIGKRSLMAHTQQISTAGHNISNADTEGYSRQRVQIKTMDPLYRADLSRAETPGQLGQGSCIESITRLRDELLDQRIVAQGNQESYWETREKYYSMIEDIYNEPDEISVRGNMDKYWQGWQELSMYPESQAARQAIVTRGESLAESIQQRFKSLSGVGSLINGDIEGSVRQVNDIAKQIASINSEIVKSKAVGDNPNDLMDRRDVLVEKLSKLANITSDNRDSDEFMVHLDGHILVQGHLARGFDVEPVTDNSGYSKVVWNDTGADAHISGGSLGALIELRDVDIRNEIQSLNTMTMNFADLVNDVHRNAVGANNVTGIDFFSQQPFVTDASGNYDRNGDGTNDSSYVFRFTGTNRLNPQEKVGLDGEMVLSGKNGNVTVPYHATDTIEEVIARINDSDGEVKAYLDRNSRLVLKATTAANAENPDFVIRHIEDSGLFLTGYSGILSMTGPEGAYDFARADAVSSLRQDAQFAVSPVQNPAAYISVNQEIKTDVLSVAAAYPVRGRALSGDGRAAVEIASIRNTYVMIGKDRTFDDYFANSVTNVGLKGEQAETNYLSQNAVMNDLRGLRDSISGVNIDEELADIIKFQHGYNAAAKFVSVMDSLLDTVINRLGV
ncbi:flagellar hook-associated protein FlgK [Treponema saccharophilum]|uniref:Flagellar hook-associated protein 1 n=2 Tax=Treponema TaxID=157 RepID=H7ENT6_9SPIR|nr:flagellar hook-associated protein FlgK [Treponema saccharophilum]EIC00569.1 flagellar hook-associated protein FlgK [Treponema saccharophilum DSM 2985]BDC95657.1 flagellar hook protein FlgK [Treponema saccharophilum]